MTVIAVGIDGNLLNDENMKVKIVISCPKLQTSQMLIITLLWSHPISTEIAAVSISLPAALY